MMLSHSCAARPGFAASQQQLQRRRCRSLMARSSGADGAKAQVKLSVNKHVEFGESVALVGNLKELGQWSPSAAHTLTWNEGDTWTTQLSLPIGVDIEYKYVRTYVQSDSSVPAEGGCEPWVSWQEGDNLTLQLPEGTTDVTIVDSWESGHSNMNLSKTHAESTATIPTPAVAEEAMREIVSEAPAVVAPVTAPKDSKHKHEEEEEEEEEVSAFGVPSPPSSNILPGPIGKPSERKPVVAVVEEEMAEAN